MNHKLPPKMQKPIFIISDNGEAFFSLGLRTLLLDNGYDTVKSCSFHELELDLIVLPDNAVFIFLPEKQQQRDIADTIFAIRKQWQFPALTIDYYGFSNTEIKKLLTLKGVGVVSHNISLGELLDYINKLCDSETSWVLSEDIQRRLLENMLAPEPTKYLDILTVMERKVIMLAKKGHSIKQTAAELKLSKYTVAGYRCRILKKAGVHSMVELIAQTAIVEADDEIAIYKTNT